LSRRSGRSNFLRGWALPGPGRIFFFSFLFVVFVLPLHVSWLLRLLTVTVATCIFFFLNFHTISEISIKIAPPLYFYQYHMHTVTYYARLDCVFFITSIFEEEDLNIHEKNILWYTGDSTFSGETCNSSEQTVD